MRSTCWARPARSCRGRSGRTSCTATSAACRRPSTSPAERALASLLLDGVGLLTSAHDLSDGGLAQALAEASLRRGVGATVSVGDDDPFVELFSESAARAWSPSADDAGALEAMAGALGVPLRHLGSTGGDALVVEATSPSPSTSSARPGPALSRCAGVAPCESAGDAPSTVERGLRRRDPMRLDDLVISRSLTVKSGELKERFSRSSGPGGRG